MEDKEITTILGQGSSFDGKLSFEGAVRIDGRFSGEIRTEGTLVVGETAEVQADVEAATVIVQGVVRGDLRASESLEIHAPARVYGNLTTPTLTIQKGAIFQGNSRMEGDDAGRAASAAMKNGKSTTTEAPRAEA